MIGRIVKNEAALIVGGGLVLLGALWWVSRNPGAVGRTIGSTVGGAVAGTAVGVLQGVNDALGLPTTSQVVSTVKTGLYNAVNTIKKTPVGTAGTLAQGVYKAVNSGVSSVSGMVSGAVSTVKKAASSVYSAVTGTASGLWKKITG